MHSKKMKEFISILLMLGLVFTSGAFSFAVDYDGALLDPTVIALEDTEFEPVIASTDDSFVIKRVQVVAGGEVQARYRDTRKYDISKYTVYKGDDAELATNGENASLYYTTARSASLIEPRNFTVELMMPRGDYDGIGTGQNDFNPADVAFTYSAGGWNPIGSVTDRAARISADQIFMEATLNFNSTVSATNSLGMNMPYVPYYSKTNPSATDWTRTGNWPLIATYDGDVIGEMELRMAINDTHVHMNEMDKWSEDFAAQYPDGTTEYGDYGRYMKVESFGVSRRGNQLWGAIIADSKASVEQYVNVTVPLMNTDPEALQAQVAVPGDNTKQVVVWTAIHGNESLSNGINPQIIDRLMFYDTVKYTETDEDKTQSFLPTSATATGTAGTTQRLDGERWTGYTDMEFDIDAFLDKFIVIVIHFTNTDGNRIPQRPGYYNTDPNRDGGHWALPETRLTSTMLTKWNPTYIGEFHGYVTNMLVCALTPPANPAVEVDQQLDNQTLFADAWGRGVLGLSPYDRYLVPYRDMPGGWDNASVLYTPSLATMFGTMGLTIELARSGDDDMFIGLQGSINVMNYILQERDYFFDALLIQKIRGVNNIDAKDIVAPYFTTISPYIEDRLHLMNATVQNWVNANRAYMDRPRLMRDGVELSFFPDYYILPVDPALQFSPSAVIEALTMLQDFAGVIIRESTEPVTYEGVTYPAGTYLIDLRQGNRTVANTLLYPGYNASLAPALYDGQTTVSWPGQKGFNTVRAWAPDLFAGKSVVVDVKRDFRIDGSGEYVVVRNSDRDALRLAARMLVDGRDIYMVTGYVPGAAVGDFVARREDVIVMSSARVDDVPTGAMTMPGQGGYPAPGGSYWGPQKLSIFGVDAGDVLPVNVTKLVVPRINVARPTASELGHMWDAIGFPESFFVNGATGTRAVHVGTAASANANIPAVVWGAANTVANNANMLGANAVGTFSASGQAEMLGRATWSNTSLVAPGYGLFDQLMAYNNAKYTNPRSDIKVLAAFDIGGSELYLAGRKGEVNAGQYSGGIVAISGVRDNGTGVTVMNENPTTRGRYWAMYNVVGTSVLAYAAGIADTPRPAVSADFERIETGVDHTVALDIRAEDTAGIGATIAAKKYKINDTLLEPLYDPADPAWKDIPAGDAVTVFDVNNSGGEYFLHWYVENSNGASSQGNFGPYVKVPVGITFSAPEVSGIENDVVYTLSLSRAGNVLDVELEFVVDGNMLAFVDIEPQNGFDRIDGIAWKSLGGDVWKGSVTLGYPSGDSTGFTDKATADIAKFVFAPRALGEATVELTSVKVAGLRNEVTAYIDLVIEAGEATTLIDKLVYSKYDLNKDGIVDALDLGIMLLYCGFDSDSPNWATLVKVNDSKGNGVTASMCDVNDDGMIDMLDLLDLFIHYTK